MEVKYKKIEELMAAGVARGDEKIPISDTQFITVLNIATAIGEAAVPMGVVQAFAGPSTVIPKGWKLCNGAALSKVEYADLYAVIGNTFGSTSTTFNIPDLRGEFIRGYSGQRYVSGEGYIDNGRVFGSTQRDALQNITGAIPYSLMDAGTGAATGAFQSYRSGESSGGGSGGNNKVSADFDASRVARTSTETRPHNVALNYIIKVQKISSL